MKPNLSEALDKGSEKLVHAESKSRVREMTDTYNYMYCCQSLPRANASDWSEPQIEFLRRGPLAGCLMYTLASPRGTKMDEIGRCKLLLEPVNCPEQWRPRYLE